MNHAGFWVRLMAYNVDFLFYLFFAFVLRMAIDDPVLMYGMSASSVFIYEVIFLISPWSATPGRRLMGIQVIRVDNKRLTALQAAIRTILKVVSLSFFFIGFAMIAVREDKKALHDLLTGCLVVRIRD